MLAYYGLVLYWIIVYISIRGIGVKRRLEIIYLQDGLKETSLKTLKHDYKLISALLMGMGLFIVMGFRHYTVGVDTKQYLYIYNYLIYDINLDIFSNAEWGFQGFNSILRSIGINDQGYILLIALIITSVFTAFFYKHSMNIFLSFYLHLTIGLFSMSMSGIRQTLAVSLILIAYHFMRKNKLFGFLACIILAYSFHNSAICFLPMYLFRNVKINRINGTIFWFTTLAVLLLRKPIANLMASIVPDKYSDFQFISDTNYVNPILIIIGLAIPITCLFFWNTKSILYDNDKYSFFFMCSCVNAFAQILSLNSILLGRLSYYFLPFTIVLIANVICNVKNKNIRVIAIIFCLLLPFIQFSISSTGGVFEIDEYKLFWK